MRNVEIKAPLEDRLAVEDCLRKLGARLMWTRRQADTFFAVNSGWLKVREMDDVPAEVISYRRSTAESCARTSDYDVQVVNDPNGWKRLLSRVMPVDGVVYKKRTLWLYESTRVHIDEVKDLGEFLELETLVRSGDLAKARSDTERLIEVLSLERSKFIAVPYRDLLTQS